MDAGPAGPWAWPDGILVVPCALYYLATAVDSARDASVWAIAHRLECARGERPRARLMSIAAGGAGGRVARRRDDGTSAGGLTLREWLGGAAAGAVANGACEAALYPLDTIKTRLQAVPGGGGGGGLFAGGLGGLYRGLLPNLAGQVPSAALFFAVYEPAKTALAAALPAGLDTFAQAGASVAASLAASLIRVPAEVLKQRLQAGQFSSAPAAAMAILAAQGPRGLFAGYGSFLVRDVPYDAIKYVAYDTLRGAWGRARDGRPISDMEIAALGGVTGAVTGALTTPLDVIKTRLMTQGARGTYKGVLDCASQLLIEGGPGALFKGVLPRVANIGLSGLVFFVTLEQAKKWLV